MTTTNSDDPRLWDEDRVVSELCHKPDSLFAKVPNRDRLEQALRDNDVNGECLLDLDVETLKTELGITSLGQRKAIMKGIDLLLPRPVPFTMEERVRRYQEGLQTPDVTHPHLSRPGQSPMYSANDPRPSIEQEIAQTPSLVPQQYGRSSTMAPCQYGGQYEMSAPRQPMHLLQQGLVPTYATSMPGNVSGYAVSLAQQPYLSGRIPAPNLFDGKGTDTMVKRAPQASKQEGSSYLLDVIEDNIDQTEHFRLPQELQSTAGTTVDAALSPQKPKKRIAPTFVSHIESKEPVPRLNGLERLDDHAYYGLDAVPVQATFYGSSQGSDDGNLDLFNSKPATGYRGAIARRIQHFLLQPTVNIPNTKLLARLPYSSQQCDGNSKHFFTLFPPGGEPLLQRVENWPGILPDKASVELRSGSTKDKQIPWSQEPLAAIDVANAAFNVLPENTTDPTEFGDLEWLLDKYPAEPDDDEGLPVYGDSDEDNQYDERTWKEIEAEQAERKQASNVMVIEDVASAIEDAIRDFEKQWHEEKLPKVKAKAYQLWLRAARAKMRKPEREIQNRTLQRCEVRLGKLKQAVMGDIWHKAVDVKGQCQSMEETVYAILESRHMLKILNEEVPPTKPDKQSLEFKPKPRVELPEGEEILESEDDLEAFIVDDSSSAEDIPFTAEDDFNPMLPTPSPVHPQPQQVSNDEATTAKLQHTVSRTPVDQTGDEADIESDVDDKIMSPLQKKRRFTVSVTARKPKQSVRSPVVEPGLPSYSESESDSDLDAPPKLPRTRYKRQGISKTQAIDLTFSDPPEPPNEPISSEFDVKTPPLNPDEYAWPEHGSSEPPRSSGQVVLTRLSATKKLRPTVLESSSFEGKNKLPALEDVKGIRKLDWMQIEDDSDRIRALFKGVYCIDEPEFSSLFAYMANIRHMKAMRDQVLRDGLMSLSDPEGRVRKVSSKHQASAQLLTFLFMTYVCCKGIVNTGVLSQADLDLSFDGIKSASTQFFGDLEQASGIYETFLSTTIESKRGTKRKAKETTQDFITDDTSSDVLAPGEEPEHSQSFKKRKRAVAESHEAKSQQMTDKKRVQEQEARRAAMESKFTSMVADGQAEHYVNFEEPLIPLDPHIAGRVKPHQVNGISFLWREIIEDPKHHGCLLAHTMGLGKTMQVISLLVTIAQCNESEDPKVQAHIPQHLRRSQTLIVCPPSLLDNWYDELVMWLPRGRPTLLGALHKISSGSDAGIKLWANEGGVMIMSYDLFRTMLKPSKTRKHPVSDNVLAQREKWLLETASLVVADEAHKMKNAKAAITQVARRIKTRSRIALTGSPLNNHLEEYHTMVDWIAPNYLGEMVQFRAKYVEPINNGLYAESTPYDRRVCLKKLHVLKQDLAPKVNRADISAISKDLPSKTEYFITLPLTDLQRQAYDIYAEHMIKAYGPSGHTSKKGLFGLIFVLVWLCNHPSIFVKKFEARQRGDEKAIEAGHETDTSMASEAGDAIGSPEAESPLDINAASPDDADVSAMEDAVRIFDDVDATGGLADPRLSYRSFIVQQILRKSIDLGDKTLLFSHSLDTLEYLGSMLEQMGCKYMCITGKTLPNQRQEMTKHFNNRASKYKVCLISTKAGGLGLNLQGASRVIIYDFGFNPMWEEQAIGRAYRLGQKQPVHVYRFRIGGTIEEVVNNKAVFKTQLFSRVVDKKNPTRYASNSVSEYLFSSRDVPQRNFDDCIGRDPDVLDAIIADWDKIRNIELTETFHKEDDEHLNEQELKEANEEYERHRLQRDDPVEYQKQYGMQNKPTQAPGFANMTRLQTPRAFQSVNRNIYQPATTESTQTIGPRGRTTSYVSGAIAQQLVNLTDPKHSGNRQLADFGPNQNTRPQGFDEQNFGNIHRPGAPSPPSIGNSPAAQDTATPDAGSGSEVTTAPNPRGCKPQ